MKNLSFIILLFIVLSCGKNKSVQLPEIKSAEVSKIHDVSPAYIFYNEAHKDSVELNRKNLIISTNWLFNIDKRLTLKQLLPSLIFLQNKKRNAKMHKNEAAKNYFTCHDTSKNALGFIEFTNTVYDTLNPAKQLNNHLILEFKLNGVIADKTLYSNLETIINTLTTDSTLIVPVFNKQLSFQDYISYKWKLTKLNSEKLKVSDTEFIY